MQISELTKRKKELENKLRILKAYRLIKKQEVQNIENDIDQTEHELSKVERLLDRYLNEHLTERMI